MEIHDSRPVHYRWHIMMKWPHACTISGICGVFAITLMLIMQNYWQLLLCPVVSINAIHFFMVSLTLTSQGFMHVQNQLTRLVSQSPAFTRSVPLLGSLQLLSVRFRILFKINLLTYKTLFEKQPVYFHFMLAASLQSRSLKSNKDNSLSVPRVKTNTGARAFHSCVLFIWNNLPLSVHSTISVATLQKHLKTHLFDLAFPS